MHSAPLVSVIIPAFNAAWCVRRAVDSVLAQTFTAFELIVVDDGSIDDTADVLAHYGEAIRVLRKANGGLSSARNSGINAAHGRYVAFLDADDWWLPEKLDRQVELMEVHPEIAFCSTRTSVRTSDGGTLPDWCCADSSGATLERIFLTIALVAGSGSAVMARREACIRVMGFDETLKSLEDIDMWMRLAGVGGYACIDEPLAVILKRAGSMSGNLDVMRSSAIEVMKKNRHLLPTHKRGAFWRAAYATMLADYAKWEHRDGRSAGAAWHLLQALLMSPFSRGRLTSSLLLAVITQQKL